MEGYQKIKEKVAARDNAVLLALLKVYQAEDASEMSTEETLIFTAITSELEDRGIVRFEESTGMFVEVRKN